MPPCLLTARLVGALRHLYHELQRLVIGYAIRLFRGVQTGGGKTYTMLGGGGVSKDQALHVGIAPRAARHVFQLIAAAAAAAPLSAPDRFDYDVRLQVVEIYNVRACAGAGL